MSMPSGRSTRRDPRHPLRRGAGSVTFLDPRDKKTRSSSSLTNISIAGLTFELDGEAAGLEPGTMLSDATVQVGDCELHGDILVKCLVASEARSQVGGLFYPSTDEDEKLLMTLISGVEAYGCGNGCSRAFPSRAVCTAA